MKTINYRWLILPFAIAIVGGCQTSGIVEETDAAPPETEAVEAAGVEESAEDGAVDDQQPEPPVSASLQTVSLNYVFYLGNPEPPRLQPDERQQILERFVSDENTDLYIEEKNALQDTFGYYQRGGVDAIHSNGTPLWMYAARDQTGNGIIDFRVSRLEGKFFENDPDIDDDGVRNVLDAEPYDDSIQEGPDQDVDGVPDHIDFDHIDSFLKNGGPERGEIQARVLEQYGVALVERTAAFTLTLAQAVEDTLGIIGRRHFENNQMATLRTVSADDWEVFNADSSGGDESIRALMVAQSGTMFVYESRGIKLPAYFLIGLIAHEFGHAYQYSLDFDQEAALNMRTKDLYDPVNYYAELEELGWTFKRRSKRALNRIEQAPYQEQEYIYKQFVPAYHEIDAHEANPKYQGIRFEELGIQIDELAKECPNGGCLIEAGNKEVHVVGPYSMTNQWEWHAENLLAYLFYGAMDHTEEFCSAEEHTLLKNSFVTAMATVDKFYPENARGNTKANQYFRERFPISDEDWDYLVCNYILTGCEDTCPVFRSKCEQKGIKPRNLGYKGCFDVRGVN